MLSLFDCPVVVRVHREGRPRRVPARMANEANRHEQPQSGF
jgi:hypothetical protein